MNSSEREQSEARSEGLPVVASQDALRRIIGEAVAGELARRLPELVERATLKPYLTKDEVCELTGWSRRKVEYEQAEGKLPYRKRGRTILFRTADVFAYIEAGRVPARKGPLVGAEAPPPKAPPADAEQAD